MTVTELFPGLYVMASAWDGQGMASGIDTASDSRFLMEVKGQTVVTHQACLLARASNINPTVHFGRLLRAVFWRWFQIIYLISFPSAYARSICMQVFEPLKPRGDQTQPNGLTSTTVDAPICFFSFTDEAVCGGLAAVVGFFLSDVSSEPATRCCCGTRS